MIPVLSRSSSRRLAPATGGGSSYSGLITSYTSLKGYWRLGESSGTSASDTSGNGHAGTYTNGPTLGTAGAIFSDADTAATFDGSNDYVDLGTASALNPTAAITIEAWIKTTASSGSIVSRDDVSSNRCYSLYIFGGTLIAFVVSGTGSLDNRDSGVTVNDGAWHHCVMTCDTGGDGKQRIYVDGSLADTGSSVHASLFSGTEETDIGARHAGGFPLASAIDEVAIYNAALTGAQILANYNRGKFGT